MKGSLQNSVFEDNLIALEALHPQGGTAPLRTVLSTSEVEVVQTRSGYPTWRARGVWVYSQHDPMREAHRLIEREIPPSAEVCLFENFALGYHIEAFLDSMPNSRAIVVEPDLRWFRAALETRDLTRILASERVTLLLDTEAELVPSVIGDSPNPQVVRLRSLAWKNVEYFQRVLELVRAAAERKDINKNTLSRFGRRWVRNLIANIELIPQARGVKELSGRFDGIPCIILAAGPSLDLVVPHIPALRDRFLLICVDTSYRAVLDAEVTPDFLVVVDPQYWNARHLDGCSLQSTVLLSESSSYPSVFRKSHAQLFFCGSLFPLGQYLERAAGERGKLGAGGSVATTTWDFARLLGCGPIFCAGLDLGFPQFKTHFRGGFFEERAHGLSRRMETAEAMSFHLLRDAAPYPVLNNVGGTTLTDKRLVLYKWWFEEQLKMHPETITFNLSPQGVKIEGMDLKDIADLLAFPVIRPQIDREMWLIKETAVPANKAETALSTLKESIEELVKELERLRSISCSGVLAVDDLEAVLRRGESPRPKIDELEAIDQEILRLVGRHIAGFLVHATAQSILDHESIALDSDEVTEQTVQDSRLLYSELQDAAEYHIRLLRSAENRLNAARGSKERR